MGAQTGVRGFWETAGMDKEPSAEQVGHPGMDGSYHNKDNLIPSLMGPKPTPGACAP